MLLGACAALALGPLAVGWLALTVLGIFAIEVAKNASGEIFDFDSGTDLAVRPEDRSPFSGGKRVLVDGLLTRQQTWGIATIGYAAGAAVGVAIATLREPAVLWLGAVGVALAFFYHAPPLKLSYRGLGEITVALCYGPLICWGTYLVQRTAASSAALWASIPLGILIGAFLWINEFPDYEADRRAGKQNMVVRMGREAASQWLLVLFGVAFTGLALLPAIGVGRGVWLGFIAAPPAAAAAAILRRNPRVTLEIVPAQALTLSSFLLYAVGAGVGLLL